VANPCHDNGYISDGYSQFYMRKTRDRESIYQAPEESYFLSQMPFVQLLFLDSLNGNGYGAAIDSQYRNDVVSALNLDKLFWDNSVPKITSFTSVNAPWPEGKAVWTLPLGPAVSWADQERIVTYVAPGLRVLVDRPIWLLSMASFARIEVVSARSWQQWAKIVKEDGVEVIRVYEDITHFRQPVSLTSGLWRYVRVTFGEDLEDLAVRWIDSIPVGLYSL